MQRPWGRTRPGALEEQRGGPGCWSRTREWGEAAGRAGRGRGFYPQGGRRPGGRRAEGRQDLTRVLTGAPFWGRRTAEGTGVGVWLSPVMGAHTEVSRGQLDVRV